MRAYWYAHNDEDVDLDAEIIVCKLVEDKINVIFESIDDNEKVEGRLSLAVTNNQQVLDAVWRYPGPPIEKNRFTESSDKQDDVEIKAKVMGVLLDFDGDRVKFRGTWVDELNGPSYDFEIDARIN